MSPFGQGRSIHYIAPVLLSFFVSSFCDLVGIGVDRAKLDFELSHTLAQLIPSAVFLWFFILSVPVGILQARIGKRHMLTIGVLVTALGLLIPFFLYSFPMVLAGFALLGIGNTIVQVSANPLLVDVVPGSRRSSMLSFSQFVKSIGSMAAAPLAGWFAIKYGDWKILLVVFGIVSILNALWLNRIRVEEQETLQDRVTMASAFSLLRVGFVGAMVLCIFLIVGIDVGVNAVSGQFLLAQFDSIQTVAESGRSLYFFGKMIGTFLGTLLLVRLPGRQFLTWSGVLGLASVIAFLIVPAESAALVMIFLIGLGVANIFPLVFSLTVEAYPERANEISGLMMMAICGGAVIPPIMGWIGDTAGIAWSFGVLIASFALILMISLSYKIKLKTK